MNFVFISSFITLIGFTDCFCLNKTTTIAATIENTEITKIPVAGVGAIRGVSDLPIGFSWVQYGDICGSGINKLCWGVSVNCFFNGNTPLESIKEIGICRCDPGTGWNGYSCDDCSRYGSICGSGLNGECGSCSNGFICRNEACDCPAPSYWDGLDCECPTHTYYDGKSCVRCSSTYGANCGNGENKIVGTCGACSEGFVCINQKCDCFPPRFWNGQTCACSYNTYWNEMESTCDSCGDRSSFGSKCGYGLNVECGSCSNGFICRNGICDCPAPGNWNGSKCVVCPMYSYYDGKSCVPWRDRSSYGAQCGELGISIYDTCGNCSGGFGCFNQKCDCYPPGQWNGLYCKCGYGSNWNGKFCAWVKK